MTARDVPRVVVAAAPGTLDLLDSLGPRAPFRVVRVPMLVPRSIPPSAWRDRALRGPPPDTVVVTSRYGVVAGIQPWTRALRRIPQGVEFWAVGPETARALREAGVRRVRRPRSSGALGVAGALGRHPRRTVLYFRSDRAGPRLARRLRSLGHRTTEVVVYRIEAPLRLTPRGRRDLLRADVLVATSPSVISNLRRRLDRRAFTRLARSVPLVVLGERTLRSARGHGFRRASIVPPSGAQRFTRGLLRVLRDAAA
jgi:uroporphyrinogen-III synthase